MPKKKLAIEIVWSQLLLCGGEWKTRKAIYEELLAEGFERGYVDWYVFCLSQNQPKEGNMLPEEREKFDLSLEPITTMRRFVLRRDVDPLGISGTGIIAEGVVSSEGKVVLFWLTKHKSIGIYDSIDEVKAIHCHGDTTEIGWIDLERIEETSNS